MDDMDEQVWEVIVCDLRESCGAVCPGSARGEDCYYYAEVAADAEARRTVTEAQNNKSKLGYWRDVATGLSALVDKLRTERDTAQELAALVTEEMVALLEWLADKAEAEALSYLPHLHWTDPRIARTHVLAARIRTALEKGKEV